MSIAAVGALGLSVCAGVCEGGRADRSLLPLECTRVRAHTGVMWGMVLCACGGGGGGVCV